MQFLITATPESESSQTFSLLIAYPVARGMPEIF